MQQNSTTLLTNSFLDKIYKSGNWPIVAFFVLCFFVQFNGCFINFSVAFTTTNLEFGCVTSDGVVNNTCFTNNLYTNESKKCQINQYVFYPNVNFMSSSIISHFNLICDKDYLANFVQSLTIFGLFTGGLLGPLFGDKYGRRTITLLALFLSAVLGVAVGLLPPTAFMVLLVMKFFLGVLREVSVVNGFVLALELMPSHKQSKFGMLNQIIWAASMCSISVLAFVCRRWDYLQIVGSSVAFSSFFLPLVVSESPRWLISRGKFEEVELLLKNYVCRYNRVDTEEFRGILNALQSDLPAEEPKQRNLSPAEIFKSKYLLRWLIIMTFTWIYCALSLFSLNSLATMFPGNPFLTYCVSSVFDGCGVMIGFGLMKKSRNLSLLFLQLVSGSCLILSGFLSDIGYVSTVCLVLGKMALMGTVLIVNVTGIYIYPSSLRVVGSAIPTTLAKLSATSSPYLIQVYKVNRWLPTLIIGCFSVLVGVMNIYYPDWINKPLPETLEDAEELQHYTGILKSVKVLLCNQKSKRSNEIVV